jgi:nucleoside-diphosphate-sugar epimerase
MRAFVTGATGFIGRQVVGKLRGRGDEVVALARDPAKAENPRRLGCEIVEGNLSDVAAIRRGVQGADAVFHIGATYKVGAPKSEHPAMHDANVKGTERVLDAAIEAGVARIIHVSTGNVYGNTRGQVVDESYVRPQPPKFLSYRGRIGEAYNLPGERATLGDLVDKTAGLTDRKPPRVTMPAAVMKIAIPVGPLVSKIMGFPPNLGELIQTSDGVTFWMTNTKARSELGFQARDLEAGLRQTLGAPASS